MLQHVFCKDCTVVSSFTKPAETVTIPEANPGLIYLLVIPSFLTADSCPVNVLN